MLNIGPLFDGKKALMMIMMSSQDSSSWYSQGLLSRSLDYVRVKDPSNFRCNTFLDKFFQSYDHGSVWFFLYHQKRQVGWIGEMLHMAD